MATPRSCTLVITTALLRSFLSKGLTYLSGIDCRIGLFIDVFLPSAGAELRTSIIDSGSLKSFSDFIAVTTFSMIGIGSVLLSSH